MTTSRTRHRPAPSRLWVGAKITTDTDSDWLKQLKRSRPGVLFWLKQNTKQLKNCFKTVLKQF